MLHLKEYKCTRDNTNRSELNRTAVQHKLNYALRGLRIKKRSIMGLLTKVKR